MRGSKRRRSDSWGISFSRASSIATQSLKVVLAEFDVGWVSHVYQQANYAFDRASSYDREKNSRSSHRPNTSTGISSSHSRTTAPGY